MSIVTIIIIIITIFPSGSPLVMYLSPDSITNLRTLSSTRRENVEFQQTITRLFCNRQYYCTLYCCTCIACIAYDVLVTTCGDLETSKTL